MPELDMFSSAATFIPPPLQWPLETNPIPVISIACTATGVAEHCTKLPEDLKALASRGGGLPYELTREHIMVCDACQRNCLASLESKKM